MRNRVKMTGLLSILWFSSAKLIRLLWSHVTRHRQQAVDWVPIVQKGVTWSSDNHLIPRNEHERNAWYLRHLSSYRSHFFRIGVLWAAKHNALQKNVIPCPEMPENSENERSSLKNERYLCSIWLIPRMSEKCNSYQEELSSPDHHRLSNKPERWGHNFWNTLYII